MRAAGLVKQHTCRGERAQVRGAQRKNPGGGWGGGGVKGGSGVLRSNREEKRALSLPRGGIKSKPGNYSPPMLGIRTTDEERSSRALRRGHLPPSRGGRGEGGREGREGDEGFSERGN